MGNASSSAFIIQDSEEIDQHLNQQIIEIFEETTRDSLQPPNVEEIGGNVNSASLFERLEHILGQENRAADSAELRGPTFPSADISEGAQQVDPATRVARVSSPQQSQSHATPETASASSNSFSMNSVLQIFETSFDQMSNMIPPVLRKFVFTKDSWKQQLNIMCSVNEPFRVVSAVCEPTLLQTTTMKLSAGQQSAILCFERGKSWATAMSTPVRVEDDESRSHSRTYIELSSTADSELDPNIRVVIYIEFCRNNMTSTWHLDEFDSANYRTVQHRSIESEGIATTVLPKVNGEYCDLLRLSSIEFLPLSPSDDDDESPLETSQRKSQTFDEVTNDEHLSEARSDEEWRNDSLNEPPKVVLLRFSTGSQTQYDIVPNRIFTNGYSSVTYSMAILVDAKGECLTPFDEALSTFRLFQGKVRKILMIQPFELKTSPSTVLYDVVEPMVNRFLVELSFVKSAGDVGMLHDVSVETQGRARQLARRFAESFSQIYTPEDEHDEIDGNNENADGLDN